jgi:hypothetical protein
MNRKDIAPGAAWMKLDILCRGIEVDRGALWRFSDSGIALRNRVYNTPLWSIESTATLPQELRVGGLVIGLNSYGPSKWKLEFSEQDDSFRIINREAECKLKPEFIPDLGLFRQHPEYRRVANLYGGHALSFFSPRHCYFFADKTECGFCSLDGTAREDKSFKNVLDVDDVARSVRTALETDRDQIEQIMIVGGNLRDLDRGFEHHVTLAKAAAAELERAGLSDLISVHIATMPPHNLGLIARLKEIKNIHVMFNLEVWDETRFNIICPGKASDYGRNAILTALEALRDNIGPYRAHSLLVTGLESSESTIAGATALSELGISPIINVYHSDQHSKIGLGSRPTFESLRAVALALQDLYQKYPLMPYWKHCGRNSIDAEARFGLFGDIVPGFLSLAPYVNA